MRCVVAPSGVLPSRPPAEALGAVRHLATRFPEARLRQVPVLRAPELDLRADPGGQTRVWLALEALQVTGSFKVRGALVALDAMRDRRRVVTASAGNHGAAVAYAASVLGMQATVCVPRTIARTKRERIERYGAELVIAQSDHFDDAEALGKELAITQGTPFLSAYDDERVVLGNGTSLGFEIVRALGGVPERVMAPFGGGGLSSGLAWAMEAEATEPGPRSVWGAQSEASCAMAMSLERGVAVERLETGGTTLAEGLEGGISARGLRAGARGRRGRRRGDRGPDCRGHGVRLPRHGPRARGQRRRRPGAGAGRAACARVRGRPGRGADRAQRRRRAPRSGAPRCRGMTVRRRSMLEGRA